MRSLMLLATLAVTTATHAQEFSEDFYAAAEKYIVECATDWAESVVTGDRSRRRVYFADDFQGTSPEGARYDKAAMTIESGPSTEYVSNTINEVDVRFFGTTAIAYGDESWTKKDGTKGKWVWTDVWLYRAGEWQLVAAQDAKVLE